MVVGLLSFYEILRKSANQVGCTYSTQGKAITDKISTQDTGDSGGVDEEAMECAGVDQLSIAVNLPKSAVKPALLVWGYKA